MTREAVRQARAATATRFILLLTPLAIFTQLLLLRECSAWWLLRHFQLTFDTLEGRVLLNDLSRSSRCSILSRSGRLPGGKIEWRRRRFSRGASGFGGQEV